MNNNELINKWLSSFGEGADEDVIKEYVTAPYNHLWHLFTWGEVPCLEGDEAREAFDKLQYTEAIRFCNGKFCNIDNISVVGKVSAKELDEDETADVYIVATDFSWTYVRTHERDKWSGCGPFFCAIESDT